MGSYESVFKEESKNEPQTSAKRKLDDVQDADDIWKDIMFMTPSQSKKPKTIMEPQASKSKPEVENESLVAGDGEDEECPICLENYMSSDDKTFLPCFHCFHKDCIDQWLAIKNVCPICRTVPTGYSLFMANKFITKTVTLSMADTFPTTYATSNASTAAFVSDPTPTPVSRDIFQWTCISISTCTPDSSYTSHSTDASDSSRDSKSVSKTKSTQ